MKTFPMFLRMEGRRVVICGGGEQAAQKCRLMLKTEARIDIFADQLDAELAGLAARGRVAHRRGPATADALRGAALVFVATGCPGADASLHAVVRAAGCVVNVVDQPDLCEAITPSIVDRDPVVVAIGTEGTAPVLARQIKTRVEQLLEPRLGDLAGLAGRLRGTASQHLDARQRRGFWAWVFGGAPRQMVAQGDLEQAAQIIKSALAQRQVPGATGQGHLALVGAGPGAADLLTLRAVQRLQEADIIFYDRLVDPAVLELARRDAERVYVGKAVGACEWPQERIDQVVLAAARQGKSVVRLKSGDPAIFGRADEEIAAARAAGIPAEIVPGITAASATAATLGRSLTSRGQTDRVVLATGQCRDGDAAPDLSQIMAPGTTLALYMSTRQAHKVQVGLRAAGLPGTAPVWIVSHASTARERQLQTTLDALPDTIREEQVEHPAILLLSWPKGAYSAKAQQEQSEARLALA